MAENNNDTATMNETNTEESELVGLLAQFDDPDSLVAACNEAREAGYTKMDAYSPFPVHGIDPAIGIKRSWLPFIVLGIALGAVVVGLGMQFYTNGGSIGGVSTDQNPIFPGYQFKISGKPYFSLPANIPVTFEVIVLSSAFATFFGMWILNKLPRFSNPLHRVSRFKRATNDKFFLMLEKADEKFSEAESRTQLDGWGAVAIEEVRQDLTDTKLPSWMPMAALLGGLVLLIPPVAIFSVMGTTNRAPRLHVVPDMDWQHKFKTQVVQHDLPDGNRVFVDNRAMRQPVEGSVRWGDNELQSDSEMFQGIKKEFQSSALVKLRKSYQTSLTGQDEDAAAPAEEENLDQWITTFPAGFEVTKETLDRGRERFEIYCSACHGYAGNGDGLVNQRAMALNALGKASWTTAKSLHDPVVKDETKNPIGRIYDTITNGRANMGPYKDQIPVDDRWAIVAYVKALQETGIVPVDATAAAVEETPAVEVETIVEDEAPATEAVGEDAATETEDAETEENSGN